MPRAKKTGIPSETWEQSNVIKWSQQPSVRQLYPELALLFHIPNERADKIQAAILKDMGVKKGVPDLFLPVPAGKYHGLFIEMKALDGKPGDAQVWWLTHLQANGYAGLTCYGWQEAVRTLEWYLNLNEKL